MENTLENQNLQKPGEIPIEAYIALIAIFYIAITYFYYREILEWTIIPIGIAIAIYCYIKLSANVPSQKKLLRKKNELTFESQMLEKKFMQRQIDEKTFNEQFKKIQNELIRIETELGIKNLPKIEEKELDVTHMKQKLELKKLLEEKEKLQKQFDITEKKYLKRQIDEKTFKSLSADLQIQIAKIDGQVKNIKTEDKVNQIMQNTKQQLHENDKKEKQPQQEQPQQNYQPEDNDMLNALIDIKTEEPPKIIEKNKQKNK